MVPSSTDFNVGYFSGKQNKKQWLIDAGDLTDGIKKSGSVWLWCDSRLVTRTASAHQHRVHQRKRLEIEDDVDELVQEDKYSIPQLRLWARVQAGHYKDLVQPPPLYTCSYRDPSET